MLLRPETAARASRSRQIEPVTPPKVQWSYVSQSSCQCPQFPTLLKRSPQQARWCARSGNNMMFMTPLGELASPAVACDHNLLTTVLERLKESHLHAKVFFGAIHKLHDARVIVVTLRRQEGVLVI